MTEEIREIAREVALSFLGKPYLWGGDDPMAGFDCSGLCIEILKSVGLLPRRGDWTAQGLWNKFGDCKVDTPSLGCLVFWTNKRGDRVIHVEMALNSYLCIGASRGGRKTTGEQEAISQNAYIKVRPYGSRKHIKGYLDPFKILKSM